MEKAVEEKSSSSFNCYLSAAQSTSQKGAVNLGLQLVRTWTAFRRECNLCRRIAEDTPDCRSMFRMDKGSFDQLLNVIRFRIDEEDTTLRQCTLVDFRTARAHGCSVCTGRGHGPFRQKHCEKCFFCVGRARGPYAWVVRTYLNADKTEC
jgi:hypothetical protein